MTTFNAAQFLTTVPLTVECYSAEIARAAVVRLADDDNVELVCPADATHRLWYPLGLLDVAPAPWCLCVPVNNRVPLSEVDNHMRPAGFSQQNRRTPR